MHLATVAAPAEVAIDLPQVRRAGLPPALLVGAGNGDVGGGVVALQPVLHRSADAAVGTGVRHQFAAVIGEAVLELHRQRAAERVQPEHRVGAFDVDAADRDRGDQVPVDGFAERLVEAGAVDIDGEALRVAFDGRGVEAVEQHAGLERVARFIDDVERGDVGVQRVGQAGDAGAVHVLAGQHRGRRRHLVARHARAEQRGGADDVGGGQADIGAEVRQAGVHRVRLFRRGGGGAAVCDSASVGSRVSVDSSVGASAAGQRRHRANSVVRFVSVMAPWRVSLVRSSGNRPAARSRTAAAGRSRHGG